jgi:hypothetical protein
LDCQSLCHHKFSDKKSHNIDKLAFLPQRKNVSFVKNIAVLIYSTLFILFLFLVLRYARFFQLSEFNKWTLPVAFLIKIFVGILFNYIHEKTYGQGDLSHDGGTFLAEGKYLNDVFFQSPKHYFQLLTGIGETPALIQEHLSMTEYWSAGDLTLINDSKNVIRVHSIIHFFSGGQMMIHLALMCLLSLLAVKNLYLSFKEYVSIDRALFFWALLLIPSTIFWTSSVLKEPLLFFGISLFLRAILYEQIVWRKTTYFSISILLLIGFKPYVLVILLLTIAFASIYSYLFKGKIIFASLFIIFFTFLLGFILDKPRETVVNYLTRKQFDFVNVGKGGLHAYADSCFYYFQPHQYESLNVIGRDIFLKKSITAYKVHFGSTQKPVLVNLKPNKKAWKMYYFQQGCMSFIETTPINNSSIQLIKNIPESLTNSAIRPWPTDPGSKLKIISFIESLLLFGFLSYAIGHRRKLSNQERLIVFSLITFALLLFLLIGWTTPVLGAIARYRFPAQLALFIVGFILLKSSKFKLWKTTSS